MSITMAELQASRRVVTGDSRSVTLLYRLTGTADESAAKTHAEANAPGAFLGLPLQSLDLEPVAVDSDADTGEWTVTARYGMFSLPGPRDIGTVAVTADTQGGSQHITQSLATIARYASAGTPPDFKGAIGVGDSGPEGCDIVTPTLKFDVTVVYETPASAPGWSYLYDLTGTVNDDVFFVADTQTGLGMTLDAGECLFLGARFGAERPDGGIEFVYSFAARKNRTGLTVGDITNIDVKGWEYMWVRYERVKDAGSEREVQIPQSVHVERVYEDGDFDDLEI